MVDAGSCSNHPTDHDGSPVAPGEAPHSPRRIPSCLPHRTTAVHCWLLLFAYCSTPLLGSLSHPFLYLGHPCLVLLTFEILFEIHSVPRQSGVAVGALISSLSTPHTLNDRRYIHGASSYYSGTVLYSSTVNRLVLLYRRNHRTRLFRLTTKQWDSSSCDPGARDPGLQQLNKDAVRHNTHNIVLQPFTPKQRR